MSARNRWLAEFSDSTGEENMPPLDRNRSTPHAGPETPLNAAQMQYTSGPIPHSSGYSYGFPPTPQSGFMYDPTLGPYGSAASATPFFPHPSNPSRVPFTIQDFSPTLNMPSHHSDRSGSVSQNGTAGPFSTAARATHPPSYTNAPHERYVNPASQQSFAHSHPQRQGEPLQRPRPQQPQLQRLANGLRNTERFQQDLNQLFGTGDDVEREDYQSPVRNMFMEAYSQYREAERRRRDTMSDPLSHEGATSAITNRQGSPYTPLSLSPGPLMNPEDTINNEGSPPNPLLPSSRRRAARTTPTTRSDEIQPLVEPNELTPERLSTMSPSLAALLSGIPEAIITAPTVLTEFYSSAQPLTTSSAPATASWTHSTPWNPSMHVSVLEEGRRRRINILRAYQNAANSSLFRQAGVTPLENSELLHQHQQQQQQHQQRMPSKTFDTQPRPRPLTEREMTVTLACAVCREQKVDTVFLPCGHIVMCRWCCDIGLKVNSGGKRVECVICRKGVKESRRVFFP